MTLNNSNDTQKKYDMLHSAKENLKIWETSLAFSAGPYVFVFGRRFDRKTAVSAVHDLNQCISSLEKELL